LRCLIVDDYPPKLHLLRHIIRQLRPDAELVTAESFTQGRGLIINGGPWDVAFFDNRLHDGSPTQWRCCGSPESDRSPLSWCPHTTPRPSRRSDEVVPVNGVDLLRQRITDAAFYAAELCDG